MAISPLPLRRLLACLSALVLVAVPSLSALGDQRAAADWIAEELDSEQPDFDQFGPAAARADVILALASADARPGSIRRALGELADVAAGYVGPVDSPHPGAMAKVLLAVLVNRHDPGSLVPGRDLEEELRDLQAEDGGFAEDVFGHSLAVLALAATPGHVPSSAVLWLLERQNEDGSFSSEFDPSSPDFDVTALALQALLAAGDEEGASAAARFLADAQNPDGSWPSPFGEPNANTAGLAGQALRAAGMVPQAEQAAQFVLSLQTDDGGIRFSSADDQPDGYATLQGILALGGPPYHELEARPFADVDWEDLFAVEIDWAGDSQVTRGCDPPAGDRFCPHDPLTRGQMAAMLHRALGDTLPTGEPVGFTDTEQTVFTDDIRWLSATGTTRGCNPPAGDRFCPHDPLTRGQMAAMLHRALGDTLPTGEPVGFTDTEQTVFTDDIRWLSATGTTRGCNPPAGDRFCPHDPLTRGQMAAMLHRALGDTLPTGEPVGFTDTEQTVFADDIRWLSATGTTRGCNPPAGDRFCPHDPLTRGQMAAMLYRALGD